MTYPDIDAIRDYFLHLQQKICAQLTAVSGGAAFLQEQWVKEPSEKLAGDGLTCILESDPIFEKAGVNFSHVTGATLPPTARASRAHIAEKPFEALGISLVTHPDNPYIPTSHANLRFFTTENAHGKPLWWFGGGYDLTPYYGFVEDCRHWHRTAKQACDPFGDTLYAELKRHCDDYFYLKHRQEARGIGGLFFDDWNRWTFAQCFAFVKNIGDSYLSAYLPIVQRRQATPFSAQEKTFQQMRRGRYVEFNLLYDRGTLFGLQSGGRIESILMSLPATVAWPYRYLPPPGSAEEALLKKFLVPQDWVLECGSL